MGAWVENEIVPRAKWTAQNRHSQSKKPGLRKRRLCWVTRHWAARHSNGKGICGRADSNTPFFRSTAPGLWGTLPQQIMGTHVTSCCASARHTSHYFPRKKPLEPTYALSAAVCIGPGRTLQIWVCAKAPTGVLPPSKHENFWPWPQEHSLLNKMCVVLCLGVAWYERSTRLVRSVNKD